MFHAVRRFHSGSLAFLIVVALALSFPAHCNDTRPILVLREDDCRGTWRTPFAGLGGISALQYGKLKQIPVTWGVITNSTTLGGATLTWSELLDYVNAAGGELASHSAMHGNASSAQACISELVNSKLAIESHTSIPCTTFLQPGTWTGDAYMDSFLKLENAIGQAVQSNYQQSMAYLGGGWQIGDRFYNYGLSASLGFDYVPGLTAARVLSTIENSAATPGLIRILTCHGIQEAGGTQSYEVPADIMKAVMDKLAELRDSGRIRLMTIHDAYHAVLPEDLNYCPDPGFELTTLRQDAFWWEGPWFNSGSASIEVGGGIDGSRCALVRDGWMQDQFVINPGRYQVSWWQKTDASCPVGEVLVPRLSVARPIQTISVDLIHNPVIPVLDRNNWERKSLLIQVPERYTFGRLMFTASRTGTFRVDNLSIQKIPLDPALSVTGASAVPEPTRCVLSWNTPPDASAGKVIVRYDTATHPTSTTSGFLLSEITAVPGSCQQVSWSDIGWASHNHLFFSLFAVRADGQYAPPDLAVVKVDKTGPSRPSVSTQTGAFRNVAIDWSSSDLESDVYAYSHAIGSSPGGTQQVPWTTTASTHINWTGGRSGREYYVSVRAENPFGYWSDVTSVSFTIPSTALMGYPDGTSVEVNGTVSAVFADCYYVNLDEVPRGIKVIGPAGGLCEGQTVSIAGILWTANGERAVLVR